MHFLHRLVTAMLAATMASTELEPHRTRMGSVNALPVANNRLLDQRLRELCVGQFPAPQARQSASAMVAAIGQAVQRCIEAMVDQLRAVQHSPGPGRILGRLANFPAFAQAFGCKAGDALFATQPIETL